MRTPYALAFLMTAFITAPAVAQTVWTGPMMTFTKPDFADHTLPANQDMITQDVILTRGATKGLYNIAVETVYVDFFSPAGTEWAFGTTADIATLTFQNWENTHSSNPPSMLNQPMVMHLTTDDIYIDVVFTSWTTGNGQGNPGGSGFSYMRSTDQGVGVNDQDALIDLHIYPNPATDGTITVESPADQREAIQVELFDLAGSRVLLTVLNPSGNTTIDVSGLENGTYVIQMSQGATMSTKRVVVAN